VILCDSEIRALCEEGLVDPYEPALVNPASLDVRLGENLLVEVEWSPHMQPHSIAEHTEDNPFLLFPKEFILAETVETFFLPSFLAGQFALKSSRARAGIEHLMAGYCDQAPDAVVGGLQWQALKYLSRLWLKDDPALDAGKARFYLNRLITTLDKPEYKQ
jgi:hypothetical protein